MTTQAGLSIRVPWDGGWYWNDPPPPGYDPDMGRWTTSIDISGTVLGNGIATYPDPPPEYDPEEEWGSFAHEPYDFGLLIVLDQDGFNPGWYFSPLHRSQSEANPGPIDGFGGNQETYEQFEQGNGPFPLYNIRPLVTVTATMRVYHGHIDYVQSQGALTVPSEDSELVDVASQTITAPAVVGKTYASQITERTADPVRVDTLHDDGTVGGVNLRTKRRERIRPHAEVEHVQRRNGFSGGFWRPKR